MRSPHPVAFAFAALGLLAGMAALDAANPPGLSRYNRASPEVTARDGRLLRAFLTEDGAWRMKTARADVSPRYVNMLLAYEDRHFEQHAGFDPLAFGRAALQWARAGHIVSGGSTLTMQAARLLEPARLGKRGLGTKLLQIARALQLERRYTKDQILGIYLTLAPFGGNLEGVRAASLAYFAKPASRLDLAEAALLVALPQSPSMARPDRHAIRARAARDKVLRRMMDQGVVTPSDAGLAMKSGVPFARQPMPVSAPHLAQHLIARGDARRIETTIDADLQSAAERLAVQERAYFDDGANLAVMVVENKTRRVLVWLGGADYWGRAGQVDLAAQSRSPGSALKPFIYGLAFDQLLLHPATMMQDAPVTFGDYAPKNFDGGFQGAVTARDALRMSLNIPAVMLLDKVGPLAFTLTLENAGAKLAFPLGQAAPSLPVALGGLGISLADITMLYAGIAEGGEARALRVRADAPDAPSHHLFGKAAAFYLRDIMNGSSLPDGWAMGQGLLRARTIGFKTGTSYGYRDAWAVGFSNDYTVGVWVGGADGTPRPGHVGRDASAPILLKVFGLLPPDRRAPPSMPADAIPPNTATSSLPPSLRLFTRTPDNAARVAAAAMVPPPAIAFPPNGAVVPLPRDARNADILLKADGGKAPLTWLVNGALLGSFDRFAPALYRPDGEGVAKITVVDADGRSDTSQVRFKNLR